MPWWMGDDFNYIVNWRIWYESGDPLTKMPSWHALKNGRPLMVILLSTFLIDNTVNSEIYNVILRYAQGIAHCLAVTIMLIILWYKTHKINIIFYILPFLIWPFNAEAVLWRSASQYPFSALLICSGMYLILINSSNNISRNILGILFIVLSIMTNQVSAFLGIAIFILILGIKSLNNEDVLIKETYNQIFIIFLGFIIGGFLSYIIGCTSGDRIGISNDIIGKIKLLIELNYSVIFNIKFYPRWIIFIHSFLIILPILLILYKKKHSSLPSRNIILALVCYLSIFIIPYSAILLSKENWPSWRIMYISPIIFTSAFLYLDYLLDRFKFKKFIEFATLILLVIGYVQISRINTSEYFEAFNNDLKQIEVIDNYLREHDLAKDYPIHIVTFPDYVRTWNPYNLKYIHGNSKTSAIMRDWYVGPFLSLFSSLNYIDDFDVNKSCLNICKKNSNSHKSLEFYKLTSYDVICICP